MRSIEVLAVLFTLLASLVSLVKFTRVMRTDLYFLRRLPPGVPILLAFGLVVLIFGFVSLAKYWPDIRAREGLIFYSGWLFLAMVFGMFVRVLARNHEAGRHMLEIRAQDLIYPLLFSLVVFYPIWGIAADAPVGLFPIHAAFLNGYFWESVVASARPPTPDSQASGASRLTRP